MASSVAASALFAPEPLRAQEAVAAEPFSFDWLTDRMRLAAEGDSANFGEVGGFLAEIHYDEYQRIRFNRDRVRWTEPEDGLFQLNAFHLGWLFNEPVQLFEVRDGQATPMTFTTADFVYDDMSIEVPEDFALPGVAGFRLMTPLNQADHFDELCAFLGASYFRALGRGNRYGLSARGLAVNTGMPGSEEFPRFTDFWIERPVPGRGQVTLCAALRSASVTGAYRFVITPGETTVMDVTARLFFRNDIAQLGIAPLTSMFLFGGADPGDFRDFRPAVHDSDALILNTASGDTYLRPLANPSRLTSSYLGAPNPVSFGLIQRERDFDQYLDAQSHYELRPSLMVEPLGDWGPGTVRLVEIPSDLEGNDNIVAFWIPEAPARAGGSLELSYRLHWGMAPPGDRHPERARVLRTRVGAGGVAGVEGEVDRDKFVIDFAGGLLSGLPRDAELRPVVAVQRGEIVETVLSEIDDTGIWRLVIEARADEGSSMELTARIAGYGQDLSETWVYQWMSE